MATSAASRDSDVVKYDCCTICEKERSVEVYAEFYCKRCLTYFCRTCINSHRQHGWWFNKKYPYGMDKIMKWPLSTKMESSLFACVIHKGQKLKMYCRYHSELCCSRCVERYHRQCIQVTTLTLAGTRTLTDFKNLSVRTENTLLQIKQCQIHQEDRVKSLNVSYNEHERLIVDGMRLNIISFLLLCETSTVNKGHKHIQYTVNEMREKIKNLLADFEKSTVKENKIELTIKKAPLMSVRYRCIRFHYELFHLHVFIQKVRDKSDLSFIASKKCQEKIQLSDTFLKETFPNHVLTVNGKSEYYVRIPSDSDTCWISGACVLPDRQVMVADGSNNNKVKLLDQQYQMVSHCDVAAHIEDMCLITPSEVAVAVDDDDTHEVQFITVTQRQLVTGRKLLLQHSCKGIAHYQGDLLIADGNALFKYSLSGKQVCRLYQDRSDTWTDSQTSGRWDVKSRKPSWITYSSVDWVKCSV
ncbi:hypothetical protein DPMN_132211 [Dreissena polymorpha]|uniref:B box-type domain-containing protein n=1 Tax=Dreissena polymorpha TaxID=45954 RepID=A0A9D4FUN1_DREPO|nr:hypothetical protein DPMN_132211 [Dreissena polymorpha]